MKIRKTIICLAFIILTGCVGYSSTGVFGTGVSIALDPRSLGTQIDDLRIKEKFDFKRSAKDVLITSQLRAALIGSKKIKAVNYNIDTYKKTIYIYGIAQNKTERDEVIKEAKQILDVKDVITSIFLVDDLRVVKK